MDKILDRIRKNHNYTIEDIIPKETLKNNLSELIKQYQKSHDPNKDNQLKVDVYTACKDYIKQYLEMKLCSIIDAETIKRIDQQINDFINACNKYSGLYNKNIIISPGDINFFLISLRRTLIKDEDALIQPPNDWNKVYMKTISADNIFNYGITEEQKCKSIPNIKSLPKLRSIIKNMIILSVQIGQIIKPNKGDVLDKPDEIGSWKKLDKDGNLVDLDNTIPIHQGSFADYMFLLKDYLESFKDDISKKSLYYDEPTDGTIIEMIKL
jgi:hypothetical protein